MEETEDTIKEITQKETVQVFILAYMYDLFFLVQFERLYQTLYYPTYALVYNSQIQLKL